MGEKVAEGRMRGNPSRIGLCLVSGRAETQNSEFRIQNFSAKPSTFNLQPSSGIALVISLIMLSVTLIMAVAFLAVARRERVAVSTSSEATDSRLAADTALAVAEAQIVANLFASTNPYNFGLLVSTNYIAPTGYDPLNITNILPRPPVYVLVGNTGSNDFRFYLDLNRNGKFESNGMVSVLDAGGTVIGNSFMVGDPEWIGVLERPDAPHAANNKFISRFAYIAQPIGNTLDLNAIHNQTLNTSLSASDGYFRNQGVGSWELNLAAFLTDLNTNGYGWNPSGNAYNYRRPAGFGNVGAPFEDAFALLRYRYNTNYNLLSPGLNCFSTNLSAFPFNVDSYTVGPLQVTNDYNSGQSIPMLSGSWAGAENTNRLFALVSDLFDSTKSSANFVSHLQGPGTNVSTYDRYTFYRLLGQLGTESTVDDARMNLNYDNLDAAGNVIVGAETNLIAWTPLRFFTNAANRLLTTYSANWMLTGFNGYTNTFGASVTNGIALTNIPVLINGRMVYSPAVNRLLQLAANLYDASTNSPYPSVFRPIFNQTNGNVYIGGYEQVTLDGSPYLSTPVDAQSLTNLAQTSGIHTNVYGVPWVIGAKKGFPNFNQFYQLTVLQATRKLRVSKPFFGASIDQFWTNQMYLFSISNSVGYSFWNSYTNAYNTNLFVYVRDSLSMVLTNDASTTNWPNFSNFAVMSNQVNVANWPGTIWYPTIPTSPSPGMDRANKSFVYSNGVAVLLTNSIYRYAGYLPPPGGVAVSTPGFDPYNNDYQTNVLTPQLPHFGLITTNRFQGYILDGTNVIDYVQFAGPESAIDVNTNLADPDYVLNRNMPSYQWSTNDAGGGTPYGVVNQISVSQGPDAPPYGARWDVPPDYPSYLPRLPDAEMAYFNGFLNWDTGQYQYGTNVYVNTATNMQAPYTPVRVVRNFITWQANDPLVHYLASDLNYVKRGQPNQPSTYLTGIKQDDSLVAWTNDMQNLNLQYTNYLGALLSKRYAPWGQGPNIFDGSPLLYVDPTWLTSIKDPLVWRSDFWDFPANKYPTVGWLGRVHRGTPWQTVYLKSSDILQATNNSGNVGTKSWSQWTGNANLFDATNTSPIQDELLFDLFSATLHPNATRGNLSVNTGTGSSDPASAIASWSALFSGVVALTNTTPSTNRFASYVPSTTSATVIDPAGLAGSSSPLWYMVTNLNATRSNFTNSDGLSGVFEHVGNILRVPALTEQSPFLNPDSYQQKFGISDQVYEWLPQQSLGLLRLSSTPRYVVYCYGQALRPAPNSIVTSGTGSLTCTNYQIVGESAVRAVLRVNKQVTATATNYSVSVESLNVLPPN